MVRRIRWPLCSLIWGNKEDPFPHSRRGFCATRTFDSPFCRISSQRDKMDWQPEEEALSNLARFLRDSLVGGNNPARAKAEQVIAFSLFFVRCNLQPRFRWSEPYKRIIETETNFLFFGNRCLRRRRLHPTTSITLPTSFPTLKVLPRQGFTTMSTLPCDSLLARTSRRRLLLPTP